MKRITLNANFHPAQMVMHNDNARYQVDACGRQFGKSQYGTNKIVATGLMGGKALWLAPTYKVTDVGWEPIQHLARQVPGAKIRLDERKVRFPNGGLIVVGSADLPNSHRGPNWDLVVMDEAAYIKEETWTKVIQPALMKRKGRAIFISTPRGRNWFYGIYMKGVAGEDGYSAHHFTTYDNPYIDPKDIDALKNTMPELIFRQEILAEFIDDSGGVFRRVQDAATAEKLDGPKEGATYIMGVDVAASLDYTVITVMDVSLSTEVHVDRFTRCDYLALEDRIAAACDRWKCAVCIVESNSMGQAVIDHLQAHGIPVQAFYTSQATKAQAVQDLQAAFEHGEIKILNDPVTIAELLSFEGKRSANGLMSYSAPEGMHDDTVMSLAIAYQACRVNAQPLILFGA